MAEPRPTLTEAMRLSAARKLAAGLVMQRHIEPGQIEESAQEIAKVARRYMDGYEIAKALDSRCYWDCNLLMANVLDGFSSYLSDEIDAAEKAWAERNNIRPPHANGTRVVLRSGETGTITGAYEYGAAKFLVRIDGDPDAITKQARRIVKFEDAQALEQPASPSEAAT